MTVYFCYILKYLFYPRLVFIMKTMGTVYWTMEYKKKSNLLTFWSYNIILKLHILISDLFEDENSAFELNPCPICNRKFNKNTYDKHVVICSTTASKKRKIFDSSRQRREGTELASYLPKHFGLPASKIADKPMSPKPAQIVHPMKKNETDTNTNKIKFISQVPNSLSLHRGKSTRISKRIQPPPSEQCPHCERFFGAKAYDRHVEWCKEKAIQQAIKNTGNQNAAKDRLHARTKYKAPCLR